MRIEVDKRYPNRWREEPYYTQICELALDGLKSEKFRTMVRVGHDRFLVLGRRIIKKPSLWRAAGPNGTRRVRLHASIVRRWICTRLVHSLTRPLRCDRRLVCLRSFLRRRGCKHIFLLGTIGSASGPLAG
jgi:hypothetical protein